MKKLFLAIVVLSVLFVIGCQENSITDPITVEPTNNVQKTDDTFLRDRIVLEGLLVDPSVPFTSYMTIRGYIEYEHRLVLVDPMLPAPQYYVLLHFSINAELGSPNGYEDPIWHIQSVSEDRMYVSEEGIYLLEKSFQVQDRNDGLTLVCRFIVTTDGVGLNEMWLVLPEVDSNNISIRNDLVRDEDPFPPNIYPPKKVQVTQ